MKCPSGHCWLLFPGLYQAFGKFNARAAGCGEIDSGQLAGVHGLLACKRRAEPAWQDCGHLVPHLRLCSHGPGAQVLFAAEDTSFPADSINTLHTPPLPRGGAQHGNSLC